jgi:hypothetical protein
VRAVRRALLAAVVVAGCGSSGDDGRTASTQPPASAPEAPTAYVAKMKPIVADIGRALRGADLRRNRRDFDRGVALLRARKGLARITADPALLLAHDRLARAVARGGTLLVAQPGSEFARQSKRAGVPAGTVSAVAVVAPAVSAWAFEIAEKFRAASVVVPPWIEREKRSAERLIRGAAS